MKSKGSKGKRSKGDDDDGKMEPEPEPEMPKMEPPHEFYLDTSVPSQVFQLDKTCEGSCVGTVIPFKNPLFDDEHLVYEAGYSLGHCTVVAEHPDVDPHKPYIQQMYCLFTVFINGYGEIAVAGVGTFSPDGSTFLITAASGAYACYTGSLLSKPTDETMTKYYYKFTFADTDKCEPKPVLTPKYEPKEVRNISC